MVTKRPAVYVYFGIGGKRIYSPISAYTNYFQPDKNGLTCLSVPLPGNYVLPGKAPRTTPIEVNLHCVQLWRLYADGNFLQPAKVIALYQPAFPLQPSFEIRLGQSLLAISRRPLRVQSIDEASERTH